MWNKQTVTAFENDKLSKFMCGTQWLEMLILPRESGLLFTIEKIRTKRLVYLKRVSCGLTDFTLCHTRPVNYDLLLYIKSIILYIS